MAKVPKKYLTFKYLRNVRIHLGDEKDYSIPCDMREQMTESGRYAVMPFFHMDTVFRVELQDESPRIPERPSGMSERMHEELCDKAYRVAMAAQEYNDAVRVRVNLYADNKDIEIIDDPFAIATHDDVDEREAKAAKVAPEQTPQPPSKPNPSK